MTPYIGEIRMFAGDFAPLGWAFCDGRLLPISEFETLFALIGNFYGGDGVTTFALPDLRGRAPVHMGTGIGLTSRPIATSFGTETVTLQMTQIPPGHSHSVAVSSAPGDRLSPAGAYLAASALQNAGYAPASSGTMHDSVVEPTGGGPHENMQPYLCINFIIALDGSFPQPT